ncbi:Ethanolamine utilization protein similar to PduL [Raoultella ornithinolytica]|nr:Ethanolamine utilization protein similar to PduL [Raoultella ornithinolytica]
MIDTLLHEKITARLTRSAPDIPVGISNRHVHLSQQDVEALFGQGYTLTPFKPLRQPGQFAAQECVTVVGPKGSLAQVRVLGPTRPVTQLEISPRRLLYPRHQSAGSRIWPAGERR